MKKLFFIGLLFLTVHDLLNAQTILLQEDFSTASGTTPPAGWTIQTTVGDPVVDVWHFDNPGRRTPNSPITVPFASFDSDKLSDNGLGEEVYLTSPSFNATTTDEIKLEFDQYFLSGYGSNCTVEVFNGISWIIIYTNNFTTSNPQHSTFNITSLVQNISNAQIRFKWTGNYSWYWLIDNFKIITQPVISEQFTEHCSISIPGVQNPSLVWNDCDSDGDLDFILTGFKNESGPSVILTIYKNNGFNVFIGQPIVTLTDGSTGSFEWGDYDNDGDLDLLFSGMNSLNQPVSKIFKNDNGIFTDINAGLGGVSGAPGKWGDYDNDGDPDILISNKLYKNNGDNSFTDQTAIGLSGTGVSYWGDYDYDRNLDIFTSSGIYKNNGDNSFTKITQVVPRPSIWGDYDNDGDLDFLVDGSCDIYGNDNGSFSMIISLWCPANVKTGWGDYDNDGDLDILVLGSNCFIYRNDGNNNFIIHPGFFLSGFNIGSAGFGDSDNDGDLDILLSGNQIIKIFRNNNITKNSPPTAPQNLSSFAICQKVMFQWDKSTDQETPQNALSYNVLISDTPEGCNILSPLADISSGFRKIVNLGNALENDSYILKSNLSPGTYYWKVQAVDHAFTGSAFAAGTFTISDAQASDLSFSNITTQTIHLNWKRGNKEKCAVFMKKANTGIPVLTDNDTYIANSEFGKGTETVNGWCCIYNGTGENVNVTGLNGSNVYKIMVVEYSGESGQELYLTCSNATNPQIASTQDQFSEQTGISLPKLVVGSIVWGDYDNDDDLDILMTGSIQHLNPQGLPDDIQQISKIFTNNDDYSFTEVTQVQLTGTFNGKAAWIDYDSDGELDIMLTGSGQQEDSIKIYRNNGNNNFAEQTSINLPTLIQCNSAWGDYDNDGDPDLLLTGISGSVYISKVYKNNGQNNFEEQTEIKLPEVNGNAVWGDYDNDGDLDILLFGSTGPEAISKIYRNNGNNSFSEQTGIVLKEFLQGTVEWGDYDNDGFLDILMTGSDYSTHPVIKIYHNTGNNNFEELSSISLQAISYGSSKWGDYDNDGDLDILLSVSTDFSQVAITKVYCNNGDKTFTEQTGITLTGGASNLEWTDYDNDGDLDILLAGETGSGYEPQIHKNNSFVKNSAPSVPVNIKAIVNNQQVQFSWDKSSDLQTPQNGLNYNLVVGTTQDACNVISPMSNPANGFRKVVKIGNISKVTSYTFNSSLPAGTYFWGVQAIDNTFAGSAFATGTFTITDAQASNLKFTDVTTNSAKISWTRGNNLKCAVFIKRGISGLPNPSNNSTYLANHVFGLGSEAGTDWYCIYNGTGDNVLVTGLSGSNMYRVMVTEYSGSVGQESYYNFINSTNPGTFSTAEQFTEQKDISLKGVSGRSVSWGDYNNDSYLDILLTGNDDSNSPIAKIYSNNGNNTFTEQSGIVLTGVNSGSAAWGDYDNDDYLDILLTGLDDSYNSISKIYHNNRDNTFTEQTGISLIGVSVGDVAWGDYDNDGDLDILLTGQYLPDNNISLIYKNNGDDTFTEQSDISLAGVFVSSIAWGDYDNDGDLDILLTGADNSYNPVSRIYRNNGDNTFTEQTDISLTGVSSGSVAWGDYDNDGYLDILLTGNTTKVYHNNGDNSFTEQTGISLTGIGSSTSAAWGDYNNDGNLDIILTGIDDIGSGPISKIYMNNGNNSFIEQTGIEIMDISSGSVSWGDYNNDGNLDILLTGNTLSSVISSIYHNNNLIKNNPPNTPSDLVAYIDNGKLHLSWDKASDDVTPQKGLTYNLRIGTTPGGCEILSPMSLPDGKRTVASMGNTGHNTQYELFLSVPVPENIFYSVQAVDNGFLASAWSPEQSAISKFVADFFPNSVCQKNEIQFQDKSYSIDYPITSYYWKFIENGIIMATSDLQTPTYAFQNYTGINQVELTITNINGETVSRTKTITVVPSPLADFTALPVCQGSLTNISNSTLANSTNITGWLWDFGDGTPVSTVQNPGNHTYNPGTHNLSLTVTSDNGCTLTTIREIVVAELPSKLLSIKGNTIFCSSDNTSLSADYKDYYAYRWMANGAMITDSIRFILLPKSSASYSVEITNTMAENCITQSDPVVLTVNPSPPVLTITPPGGNSFCLNDTLSRLYAPLVNGLTYNWMVNGSLAFSGPNTYMPQQSGTYTLSVSNSDNCSQAASNSVPNIVINPNPVTSVISLQGEEKFCKGGKITLSVPANSAYSYSWKKGTNDLHLTTNSIDVTESGDYSVDVSLASCKLTTTSRKIEVVDKPLKPDIDPGSYNTKTVECLGENPVILSVDNIVAGYSYQWYKNETPLGTESSIEVVEAGNYYLESVLDICRSEKNNLSVTFAPAPPKPEIIAKGPTVWMLSTTSKASVYKWYFNGSAITEATGSSYMAGQKYGLYRLAVANETGCYSFSDTLRIPTFGTTGIEDSDPFEDVKIYPNPTTGLFTIEMNNNVFGELVIDIITQNGSKILNIKFDKTTEHFSSQIDLSGQPNGMYLVNLSLDRFKAVRKVLVE